MDSCKLELWELTSSNENIIKWEEKISNEDTILNITCLWVLSPLIFTGSRSKQISSDQFQAGTDENEIKWNFVLKLQELEDDFILINMQINFLDCNAPNDYIWKSSILNKNLKMFEFDYQNKGIYEKFNLETKKLNIKHSICQELKYNKKSADNFSLFGNVRIVNNIVIKINKLENVSQANVIEKIETIQDVKEELNFLRSQIKHIKALLNDEKYSDCTLIVEGKNIHVHKVILIAQSPIFLNMLSGNINEIEINDVKYEDMMMLLDFVYSGEIEKLNYEQSINLLPCADKYCIFGLKTRCEEVLSKCLNNENSIDILVLADDCNAKSLKDSAISFIVKNLKKYKNNEFEILAKKNPQILVDILNQNTII